MSSSLSKRLLKRSLKMLMVGSRHGIFHSPEDVRRELEDETLKFLIESRKTWKVSDREVKEIVDRVIKEVE